MYVAGEKAAEILLTLVLTCSADIVLVDHIPDWHYELTFTDHGWFPYQTIARFSGLNIPDHFAMPLLGVMRLTATPRLYQYLDNDITKSFLAQPLKTMDVNDFLHRACLLQTHKELCDLGGDVYYLQMQQCRSCQGPEDQQTGLSDQKMAEASYVALKRIKKMHI